MNSYVKPLFLLVLVMMALSACKLDTPIMPGDPNYVPYSPNGTATTGASGTITGNSGIGNDVNNSVISGTWKVSATNVVAYNQDQVQMTSVASPINLFTGVTIKEAGKTAEFAGSFSVVKPITYTLAATKSTLHIQLSEDPFGRSINDRIRITKLTANAMTWVALDPQTVRSGNLVIRSGYEVTFTR